MPSSGVVDLDLMRKRLQLETRREVAGGNKRGGKKMYHTMVMFKMGSTLVLLP